MSELSKAAKIAFASTFSFYLKAHNFHWNVEGVNFKQFHDLFGGIYEEVFDSIDTFAEQIRALGSYMPGSYSRFSMLSQIEDENNILDDRAMVVELLEDNEKLKNILKMVYDLAEEAGQHGFSNFLAERMDAHSKHGWMLRSILK